VKISSDTLAALKRPPVVIAAVVAVVVILVWLLAFFLPQGKKVSTLAGQQQTLQSQVTEGNAKVARLEHTFQQSTQLKAMDNALRAYVPSTPDLFKTTANYANLLSATVTAAGMTLTSVSPGGASAATSGSKFTTVPITLVVKGTYDDLLSLVTKIYSMSRLTDIKSVDVTGGGPNTTRSTTLSATLDLITFTTAKPSPTTP
jgi:Tfp pilus assembly protein PilO